MEFNDTLWENSFNHSNTSFNFSKILFNNSDDSQILLGKKVLTIVNWVSIGIGLPLTLVVIIAVFSQVKKDQGAPVYVINLLVSDLIQFSCRIPLGLDFSVFMLVAGFIVSFAGMVSIGFMICISFERYLVIAMPLWYRFRRNLKTSVVVCVVVWVLPVVLLVTVHVIPYPKMGVNILACFFLLPFPLFIFFLVGTIKALSGALSVSADEKRRIVAIQVVVLLIYTLLFLPMILLLLCQSDNGYNLTLGVVAYVCYFLSPLADTTLYLFSRKSILDKFLASLCSCKISNNQEMSSTDNENRAATNTETV